jgi:hypothetical protein
MKAKDRQEVIDDLRNKFKLVPGETIYTKLCHVSKSGMSRVIDLYVIRDNEPLRISWSVGQLCEGYDRKYEGAKVHGCGMDTGFHLVYNLGMILFPNGYECIGSGCKSNDHSNGDRDYTVGKHKPIGVGLCPVCHHYGSDCTGEKASHHHRDGGYAFNHRWF